MKIKKIGKTFGVSLALILLFNLAVWFMPFKLDLTAKKTHTLSKTTKEMLKSLDDVVNIKVYASTNLPSRFLLVKQVLKDTLAEYRFLSKGKIRLSWIDPEKSTESALEAQRLGIPQLQFSNIEKDKFQVTQGFLGLAVLFEDRAEVIPLVETTNDLEYQLTAKIFKLTRDKEPKIGFTTGHGEELNPLGNQPSQGSLLEEILAQEYLTERLTLDDKSPALIPDGFDGLVINGPTEKFELASKYSLDQYLLKGKPIIFLLETNKIDNNLSLIKTDHQLSDLLKNYGLDLRDGFVLDQSNELANFNTGLTMFLVPYPFWVKVRPEGINKDSLVTRNLESLVLPWVSWIEFDTNDKRAVPLLSSSSLSWTMTNNISLDPSQDFNQKAEGEKTLAVIIQGELKSFFANSDKPKEFGQEEFIEKTDKGRLALVADTDFLAEGLVNRSPQNLYFFANLVEFLTGSQGLSEIRVKAEDIRPLDKLTDQQRELIKYINMIGVPVLIGFLGFGYLYLQSKRQYSL